ncbi:MAG TPA: type II secretion system protein GspN [Kofleriaceae bacterium]|nr:type II secretion system protein GspN [Kofleriaceae bacterium]
MALPFRTPNLGPRTRKALRIAGFVLLFFVTFVFALQWTFPFSRVRDKVIEVLSAKYEVEISDVERGLIPGRVYFKAVTLRTRPTKADEVATTFYIERLKVDVGLLALIGAKAAVDIDAKIGAGHITGTIELSKGATEIHLDGDNLPGANLPMKEIMGLPMSGKVNFEFDLALPNEKLKNGKFGPNWQKAEGDASFACPSGCTIGDGKTKLRPKLKNNRNAAFAEGGIEFGKLEIDTMAFTIDISKGHLKVTKFDTTSRDGEIHVDFDMTLGQAIDESTVAGCLRFTGSHVLLKRDARTHAAISTTGAPLGPDNLYHIRLDGKVKEMKRLPQVCGLSDAAAGSDKPSRPNLTVQPTEPPIQAAPTPEAPPPPPPADAAVVVPVPGPTGEQVGSAGSGSAATPPSGAPASGELPPAPPAYVGPGAGSATGSANPVPEGLR